jgi:ankyrin repeat protein
MIKKYQVFLNEKLLTKLVFEELNILKGPSDEETFSIPVFDRIKLIKNGKIDHKFFPSDEEILTDIKDMDINDVLIKSSKLGLLKYVKYALEHGADIEYNQNTVGSTALSEACFFGNFDVIKYLVEHGANINSQSFSHFTPLMVAMENGNNLEIVKYLINHGADIKMLNLFNQDAYVHAIFNNRQDIANYIKSISPSDLM